MVLSAVADGSALKIAVRRIGPALVFERLWDETGCRAVSAELADKNKHGFGWSARCSARPHQLLARDHRRSGVVDRDEAEIEHDGERFVVRSAPRPAASLAVRAAGV